MYNPPSIRCWFAVLAIACLGSAGCRQQVYHELYAEQTARELRALEDRIYDYDNAYNELLLELDAAAAENEKLRMAVAEKGSKRSSGSGSSPSVPSLNLDSDYEIPSVLMPSADPVPNADAPSFSLTPKVEEPKSGMAAEPTKPNPTAPGSWETEIRRSRIRSRAILRLDRTPRSSIHLRWLHPI